METTKRWRFTATLFLCLNMASLHVYADSLKMIKLKNNCTVSVWPAIASWNTHESDTPLSIPTILKAGESSSITLNSSWSGSIWGRLQCTFNSSGMGLCESGDCGGTIRCDKVGNGKPMPNAITTATFTNGSSSVTLENGYNLAMSLNVEHNHTDVNCNSMVCNAHVESVCPESLQVSKYGGEVTGCKGSCNSYFRSCSPPDFASAFQKACPQAFPFQDEAICSEATSFTLTFCPK